MEWSFLLFLNSALLGVGLAMDAFSVSMANGLHDPGMSRKRMCIIAGTFGVFQAVMPLIGWALGRQFEKYITSVDHWIAFILLGYIGGKMIWDGFHGEDETCPAGFDLKELTMMAIATSIDALAVGITFAFLQVDILPAVGLIGLTTFTISLGGVWIGHRFGSKYKDKATLAGGIILCLIGLKILLEHLGMLG